VVGAHYINICELEGETVVLRGNGLLHDLAPAEDLSDLVVDHQRVRPSVRAAAAAVYYQRRDELVAERTATTFVKGLDGHPVQL